MSLSSLKFPDQLHEFLSKEYNMYLKIIFMDSYGYIIYYLKINETTDKWFSNIIWT